MAVTYQSTQTDGNTTGTSSTLTKPTSTTTNDLLIAMIGVQNGVTVTPPSDTVSWTAIPASTNRCQGFYKIAGASEPSSYAFTFAESNGYFSSVSRFTGHNLTTPINTSLAAGTTGTTVTIATGITPTVANTLLVFFNVTANAGSGLSLSSAYAVANNNPTWTERLDSGNNNAGQAFATGPYTPTTITGTATSTLVSSRAYTALILAIAPGLNVSPAAPLYSLTLFSGFPAFMAAIFQVTVSLLTAVQSIWSNKSRHSSSWTDTNKSS